jgi:hypothetical protein
MLGKSMNHPNKKPTVVITHVLIDKDGVRYFAIPKNNYTTFPKKATWVALGKTEECWIEVFPIGSSDLEGISDFEDDLEVTVDIDNSFFPLGTPYPQVKTWRWFTEVNE